MNKFAPPTDGDNVSAGTVPVAQAGPAQPAPGPNSAWNKGGAAPTSQAWAPAPAPARQLGPQMMSRNYGTFNAVTDRDGRSLGCWLIWGIGLTCAAFFMWVGIKGDGWLYMAAVIIGAVVCLLLGVTEASWSRWLVSIVSTSDGTIVVHPSGTRMILRVCGILLAAVAGVCFFYSQLFSVDTDVRSFAGGGMLTAVVVVLYLLSKIGGPQSRECIVVSQRRVDMWGMGGFHYSIPWSDQPKVIGQRNGRKSLLISAGQDVECLIVFTSLRIQPSRVRSLLAYYQTTPGALDRLSSPEAREEAMMALGWRKR